MNIFTGAVFGREESGGGGGGGGSRFPDELARFEGPYGVEVITFLGVFTDAHDIYLVDIVALAVDGNSRTCLQIGRGAGPTWVTSGYAYHTNQSSNFSNVYSGINSSSESCAILNGVSPSDRVLDSEIRLNNLRNASLSPSIKGEGMTYDVSGSPAVVNANPRSSFVDTTNKFDHMRLITDTGGVEFTGGVVVVRGGNL